MDEASKVLMRDGVQGVLMAAILLYSWWVFTKVVPKQHDDHLSDIKTLHDECKEERNSEAQFSRALLNEQRKDFLVALDKISDKRANLDAKLLTFLEDWRK